jgi:polyhydroxybutyrate depolymerase
MEGMPTRRGFLAGAAAFAAAGCAASSKAAAPTTTAGGTTATSAATGTTARLASGTPNVAGRRDHTITVDDLERDFITYTPASVVGAVAAPVVFMLHGTSGDGERFYNHSGWVEQADAEGLIAVFPSSLVNCFHEDDNHDGDLGDPGEQKVTTKWAAGQFESDLPVCTAEEVAALPPGEHRATDHPEADDVKFIRTIADVLHTDYTVDPARVYASGFSNGGQMSARLAVEAADIFSALAVAAGNLVVPAHPVDPPVSIAFSVGSQDDRFMPANGGNPIPVDASCFDVPFLRKMKSDLLAVTQLEDKYDTTTGKTPLGAFVQFRFDTSMVGANNELLWVVFENLTHDYPKFLVDPLWQFFHRFTR